jgi:hypothetical protein
VDHSSWSFALISKSARLWDSARNIHSSKFVMSEEKRDNTRPWWKKEHGEKVIVHEKVDESKKDGEEIPPPANMANLIVLLGSFPSGGRHH